MSEPTGPPEDRENVSPESSPDDLLLADTEPLPSTPARLLSGRRIVLGGERGEYGRRLLTQLALPVSSLLLLFLAGLGLERLLPMQSVTVPPEVSRLEPVFAQLGLSAWAPALPLGVLVVWAVATWVRVRLQHRTYGTRIRTLPPLVTLHGQQPNALTRGLWVTESIRALLHLALLAFLVPALLVLLRTADQDTLDVAAWGYMTLLLLLVALLLFFETLLALANTYMVFRPGRISVALVLGFSAVLRSPTSLFRLYWVWASRVLLAFGFSALVVVRVLASWTGTAGEDPTWWLSGLLVAVCGMLAVRYRMLLDRALHLMMGVHFRLLAVTEEQVTSDESPGREARRRSGQLPHAPPGWFAGDTAWQPIPLEPVLAAARAGTRPRGTAAAAKPAPAQEQVPIPVVPPEAASLAPSSDAHPAPRHVPAMQAASSSAPQSEAASRPTPQLPADVDASFAPAIQPELAVASALQSAQATPHVPAPEARPAWQERTTVPSPVYRVRVARGPITRASSGVAEMAWRGDPSADRG